MTGASAALTVMERCALLGTYSEEPDCLTRPSLTASMQRASEQITRWMQEAGMSVQQDAVGNLFGRYEANNPDAKTLLLGSHFDSVRNAGKYDGPLGILVALSCVQRLQQRRERLPFAIEVAAFTGEEGLRFHCAYLGSRVATGTLDSAALQLTDAAAVSLERAIHLYGHDSAPIDLHTPHWNPQNLLGYCEVHIEQGPVLEQRGLPIGIVSAIAGQSRFLLDFTGEAGHAGTVPMPLRRDALCAASEFTLAVERLGRETAGLVATIGQIVVEPGAPNVIPGHVRFSLDVRHQHDAIRTQACQLLHEQAQQISEGRRVALTWQLMQEHHAVACSPPLVDKLTRVISDLGYPVLTLPSGAGHDAVTMSALTDIAMLFVRCKGGISHNPAESVTTEDVQVALEALEGFVLLISQEAGNQ